jgi:hypothetical protein
MITGGPSMDADIQEKRGTDRAINSTYGGMAGRAGAVAPAAVLAGPSVGANALLGGTIGALQPTTSTDLYGTGNAAATAANTLGGAATSAAFSAVGNKLAGWATGRAAEPFMGWSTKSANAALARGVGSDASALDQAALGQRATELSQTFSAGRNAATNVDLLPTPATMGQIAAKLNPSARRLFESNDNVTDLMNHATGPGGVNGEALGLVSTGLRQDAYTALNSEGGNREVGLALQELRRHVEGQITAGIQDPALRAAYTAAMPQYGLLQDVRYNPSVLNAATGDANMEALGKYFQRNNPAYTSGATSDLFDAAQWGQSGGGAKGAPRFGLNRPWESPIYWAGNNPVSRAAGGVASRALAPVAPAIPYGFSGLGLGTVAVAVPYLEQ